MHPADIRGDRSGDGNHQPPDRPIPAYRGKAILPHGTPIDIANDKALEPAQRLRLLHNWAQDLIDRQIASAEGMTAPSAEMAAAESQLLREVNHAIDLVESGDGSVGGKIARAWRRLTGN